MTLKKSNTVRAHECTPAIPCKLQPRVDGRGGGAFGMACLAKVGVAYGFHRSSTPSTFALCMAWCLSFNPPPPFPVLVWFCGTLLRTKYPNLPSNKSVHFFGIGSAPDSPSSANHRFACRTLVQRRNSPFFFFRCAVFWKDGSPGSNPIIAGLRLSFLYIYSMG